MSDQSSTGYFGHFRVQFTHTRSMGTLHGYARTVRWYVRVIMYVWDFFEHARSVEWTSRKFECLLTKCVNVLTFSMFCAADHVTVRQNIHSSVMN